MTHAISSLTSCLVFVLDYRTVVPFSHKLLRAVVENEGMKWIWSGESGPGSCLKDNKTSHGSTHCTLKPIIQADTLADNKHRCSDERVGKEG